MQSYELIYCTEISVKVTLSSQAERELRRDFEIKSSLEIEEVLASSYLEEVAEAINETVKLPEKLKAANGCRIEINSTNTEQA